MLLKKLFRLKIFYLATLTQAVKPQYTQRFTDKVKAKVP